MRIIFLFIGIACITTSVMSQSVTVSQELSLKSDSAYDILGKIEDNVLLYRDKGGKHHVEVYDKDMAFVKDRKIDFEKRNVEIIGVVPSDSTFNLLYSYKHKGDIINMVRRYDGNMILQDSVELFRYPKSFKKKRLLMETSENKKFSILFNFESKHKMQFYLMRHDSLDIPLKKILEMDDLDVRDRFRKILVTDRAEIVLLMEQRNSRFSKDQNHFGLFILDPGTDFVYSKINFKDRVAADVDMVFDNINRRICIAGLWHDKSKDEAKGYFYINKPYITLEDNEEVLVNSFTSEFIAEITGKDIGKHDAIREYKLKELLLRQDGGFILFAEMQREYLRKSSYGPSAGRGRAFGGISGWMDHYYEDIVVLAVHPDGREHWRQVLFKKQFSQDDSAIFSSYYIMKTPSRLKVIFNDEIKNNNTVSEYVIDPIGNYNRNSLLSTDYQNLKLRFADGVQISSNSFIVPSEKNRRLSLVKIAY